MPPARTVALALLATTGFAPCLGAPVITGQEVPLLQQLPKGTPVRLMVIKEVNSREARPGDRFKLRVDEAVVLDGTTVIPVGATAWGEVIDASGTGVAGRKGRLSARLLYIELSEGRIPLSGTQGTEGKGNTAGVAIGLLTFGLAGLLNKGGNATLKAGHIMTGYVEVGATPAPIVVPATSPQSVSPAAGESASPTTEGTSLR